MAKVTFITISLALPYDGSQITGYYFCFNFNYKFDLQSVNYPNRARFKYQKITLLPI